MKTIRSATVIHCTTDDGWRYSGYRTGSRRWAGERVSPAGVVEPLRIYELSDDIHALARRHEPEQRSMFEEDGR